MKLMYRSAAMFRSIFCCTESGKECQCRWDKDEIAEDDSGEKTKRCKENNPPDVLPLVRHQTGCDELPQLIENHRRAHNKSRKKNHFHVEDHDPVGSEHLHFQMCSAERPEQEILDKEIREESAGDRRKNKRAQAFDDSPSQFFEMVEKRHLLCVAVVAGCLFFCHWVFSIQSPICRNRRELIPSGILYGNMLCHFFIERKAAAKVGNFFLHGLIHFRFADDCRQPRR